MIKIFGHKSPDTDATGSSILWAYYLNNFTSQKATPYILGKLNKETIFVLDKWDIAQPQILDELQNDDKVVVVDTNNPKELPSNINEIDLVGVIDHHMLAGGLKTNKPVEINLKPVASTATVIYDLVHKEIDSFSEQMLGLMLSCILSDTLAFRSPTTTPHDKDIAEKIAKKINVDIESYSNDMFTAKSDVSDFSDSRLILLDSKKIEIGGKHIRISVIETTTPEKIIERKEGIFKAIEEVKQEEGVDEILFFVIDIFKEESTVFAQNDFVKTILEQSFGISVETDIEVLPGVVSRKKQIIPSLKI